MSKLEELIQELCPDGVQYAPLWTLTAWDKKFKSVEKHKQSKIKKYKYYLANELQQLESEEGTVKILTTNVSDLWANECDVKNDVINAEIVCIPWGGNPIVQYFNGKFITGDNRIATSLDTKVLDNKFLYYLLENNLDIIKSFYRGSGLKHPDMSKVLDMIIPVPPLEVQKEIVRLLDDFTAKTAELQTELNKEYEARKKQYECYRDNLIRNELHISKVINLIDIADVYDSLHQTPSYSINGYNMVRVQDIKGGYINIDKTLKVEETVWKLFTQKYVPQPNDVVVSRVGSYGNFALIPDNQCCLGQNVALIHPKINPQYLYYVLTSTMTKQWINNNVKGTSQKSLSLADIKRVPIPVPNENNQKYIADILNNFNITMDELQLNISIELESRQKQYEFYRDKLLTFKELK